LFSAISLIIYGKVIEKMDAKLEKQ